MLKYLITLMFGVMLVAGINVMHRTDFKRLQTMAKTDLRMKRMLMNCYREGIFTEKNKKMADTLYYELITERADQ